MNLIKYLALAFFSYILIACGGGGAETTAGCGGVGYNPTLSYGSINGNDGTLTGTVGVPLSLLSTSNVAAGCGGSATFSVHSGALPAGLSLSAYNGEITGTPTTAGTSTFTVQLSITGYTPVISNTVTATVAPAVTSLCNGSAYIPTVNYTNLTGTAGTAITSVSPSHNMPNACLAYASYSIASGSLPDGLSLNITTGVISGTPTSASTSSFTVALSIAGYAAVNSNTVTSQITSLNKAWTMMVYIAGDNNLSEFALADLAELKAATANSNVNVVVQMEYNSTYAYSSSYLGGNTYRGLINGSSTSLSNIGTVNMSDKTTLSNFVTWSKNNYPADRYGLVLWSHGGGWKANKSYRGAYRSARGALADDSSGGFMLLKDIKAGISTAMGSTKLDLLAFDACLMGQYEVAYELKDTARYLVASEELVPGPGYPYTAVINALTSNPTQTTLSYATAMATAFNSAYLSGIDDTTLAVTDLSQMSTLHSAVLDLATALVANPESGIVVSAKAAAKTYGGTGNAQFAVDLYPFANYIANNAVNANTRNAATALTTAINNAVGTRSYTTGTSMSGSKGLAIYMPPAGAAELSSYQASASSNDAVSGKSTWKDFLSNFYGSAAGSSSKVAGNFGFYITWDNANADVDLVVNEPLGNWAAPWIGSTSPNGYLSADSVYSNQNFESYTAATMVDGGNTYDVFVHLYKCKNGAYTCTANVKVYKKDGLNAQFTQVMAVGAVGGAFKVCINCYTVSFPYTTIGTYPYTTSASFSTIVSNMWNSSDWYPISGAQVTRSHVPEKPQSIMLKTSKFAQDQLK